MFDETNTGKWKEYREFLEQNLTTEEFDNAKESVLTAFYTPKIIIDYMYKGLEKLGFENCNILEPSLGIGNFIGNIPKTMNDSKFYGVELDTISRNIAKILYPNANIEIKGFEDTNYNDNFFDIAIGNVPFGEFKVNDRKYNKDNFLIHDYFFAKGIDKVRKRDNSIYYI